MLAGQNAFLLAGADVAACCAVLLLAAVYLAKRATRKTDGRGFAACVACGFENFSRLMRCALCGLSGVEGLRPGPPTLSAAAAAQPDATTALPLLPRAHKRKQWTRRLDTHGRLVWHRRGVAESDDLSPGYVLRFDRPTEDEPEAERAAFERKVRKERTLSAGYDPRAGVQFELMEAHEADPLQFPLPPPHVDLMVKPEELKQLAVSLAAQDFPTKYAHLIASATALLQADVKGGEQEKTVALDQLSVHRDYILEQSVAHINCIREAQIRSVQLRIHFIGEGASNETLKDAGGLHREWLTLLNERLVDPSVGLFVCTQRSDQTYFINAQSARVLGPDHLQYFHAVGRLVGRALLEGAVLNFHLCVPLLKMMLGTPVTFGDLEDLDAEMYRNLMWLLDHDGAETLELDFTVAQRHGKGAVETVELIPAGRNIQVNDDNKFEFADRKFRFTLFESVAPQLAVFLKGFYEVVPQRLLLLFDYEELDYLLCGSDEIDVADWQRHTRVAFELRREVAWFWEVVQEMSSDYQRGLLQFATGCSRVPLVGFQGLTSYDGQLCEFTLADARSAGYFRSHACHNMLELPCFATKDELHDALYATLDNEASRLHPDDHKPTVTTTNVSVS
ncbi:hypothetical protein BBJ28_00000952 [Nothophytophthora sp. Chile5]|nr:hypothetical protein BBJ28_00000952 [Nothophytophthora sp. Chile5]